MWGAEDTGGTDSDATEVDRRAVLRAAGTAAGVGALGTAAIDPAVATTDVGLELLTCATVWADAPEGFPRVDVTEGEPTTSNVPTDAEEVVFYYVGWNSEGQVSDDQAYTLQRTLRDHGYDHPVVTVQWEAATDRFSTGEDNADRDGRRFADWLRGYHERNPETTIRLAGLSLGARPPLATLDDLDGDVPVASASLFGAAVDDDAVCADTIAEFDADAVDATAERVFNYYSREDDTICVLYELQTFDDGLGCSGIDCGTVFGFGDPPESWVDVDVTDDIGNHCLYQVPGEGIGERIVADIRSVE